MKSNIYTKTGDNGTTALVGGKRVKKTDIRLEAYGSIDELNSFIGFLAISAKELHPEMYKYLREVQGKMFYIGAYLATDNPNNVPTPCKGVGENDVEKLEHMIDELDGELPPLTHFIMPGSSTLSAEAHICRTVTRRCERRVLSLSETTYIDPILIKFLNRLSDFFFVFARFNNIHNQIEEVFWDPEAE